MPDTRQSVTHKFNVNGHEGYVTVGLYDDGRPGELFITMAKEGSTIGGLMDSFGTAVSMSLQYGVPLEVLVNKFSHSRFEPMGYTTNPDIRIAKSLVDYIFRWLGLKFLPGYREASQSLSASVSKSASTSRPRETNGHAKGANGQAASAGGKDRNGRAYRSIDAGSGEPRIAAGPKRSVRPLPKRCPQLRQLWRHHRPQRQLLPLPQLRKQHGLLVNDPASIDFGPVGSGISSTEPADEAFEAANRSRTRVVFNSESLLAACPVLKSAATNSVA